MTKINDRTWRTQCTNYLAWGYSRLTREQAIAKASESHSNHLGMESPQVDEANQVVYYHARISL